MGGQYQYRPLIFFQSLPLALAPEPTVTDQETGRDSLVDAKRIACASAGRTVGAWARSNLAEGLMTVRSEVNILSVAVGA